MQRSMWSKAWLVPVVYGLILITLSSMFFFHPAAVTVGVVWTVGFFWLGGGILKLVSLFFDRTEWGLKLFSGLLSTIVGSWIVFPGSGADAALSTFALTGAVALVWIIGGMFSGFATLAAGFSQKNWGEGFLGVFEILIAGYLLFNLIFAAAVVPLVVAIIALLGGIWAVVIGLKARKIEQTIFS